MTEIRPAVAGDVEALWRFLAMAAYEPNVESAKAVPVVATHLAGWKRAQDFGVLAFGDGQAIGAAWARQFAPSEQPPFYVDDRTPEVSIAVAEAARSRGVGRRLLAELIVEARRRKVGLSLTVRETNPAIRLYLEMGFVRAAGSEFRNRTGGWSVGMLLPS